MSPLISRISASLVVLTACVVVSAQTTNIAPYFHATPFSSQQGDALGNGQYHIGSWDGYYVIIAVHSNPGDTGAIGTCGGTGEVTLIRNSDSAAATLDYSFFGSGFAELDASTGDITYQYYLASTFKLEHTTGWLDGSQLVGGVTAGGAYVNQPNDYFHIALDIEVPTSQLTGTTPEPASFVALALPTLGLLTRRRSQRRQS